MIAKADIKLRYCFIENRAALAGCFDDLVEGVRKMIGKTGQHGQSIEVMVKMITSTVGLPSTFLLVGYDEDNKFQGFLYAMFIASRPAWVDIIGVYTVPGVGMHMKHEVFDFLKLWGRKKGAVKIMAGITRSPQIFYENFHRPLGFHPVGIIVEYDLKEKENGNDWTELSDANSSHFFRRFRESGDRSSKSGSKPRERERYVEIVKSNSDTPA